MEVREATTNRCLLAGLSFALGVVVFATHANAQEGEPAETPTGEAAEAAVADAPAEVEAEAPAEPAAEVPAEPAKPEIKAVIAEGSSEASSTSGVAFIEDTAGTLTIEKILEDSQAVKFESVGGEAPNFGFNPSVFWFKVQVENLAETVQWVVEVDYSMLDTIVFYAQGADGTYQPQTSGDSEPFDGRYWAHRNPNFKIDIWQGDTAVVYLKVQTAELSSITSFDLQRAYLWTLLHA